MERRLALDAGLAKHIRLELPEQAQREEKGRRMLGASVRTYEALGIDRVALSAVAIGRYVWAVCGFSFSTTAARTAVAHQIRNWIAETGIPFSDLDWELFEPYEIAYAESSEPLSLREWLELLDDLADYEGAQDLDEPVTHPGKLLLLNRQMPSWDGVLGIGSSERAVGYELMRNYTGLN